MHVANLTFQNQKVAFSAVHVRNRHFERTGAGPQFTPFTAYHFPEEVSDNSGFYIHPTDPTDESYTYAVKSLSEPVGKEKSKIPSSKRYPRVHSDIAITEGRGKIYYSRDNELNKKELTVLGILNGDTAAEDKIAQITNVYQRFDVTEKVTLTDGTWQDFRKTIFA